MKKTKYISNQSTPWDAKPNQLPIENFIASKYKDDYLYKHKLVSDSTDIKFLNTFNLSNCKYCQSNKIKLNGYYKSGIKRYFCNECKKSFNILTNTIFDNHKLPISEWISFCLELFNYSSTQLLSRNDKKSYTTINLWLHKVFYLLKDYQNNILLDDYVQIDETYYTIDKKEITLVDGKKKRGLSKDKYCIAVGWSKNKTFAIVMGRGKPSAARVIKAYSPHIKENSLLIHDMEKSHNKLVSKLNLTEKKYNSKDLKKLENKGDNPMYEINHIHALLKEFLKSHSGFNKTELQDYLNLFCFIMNEPKDKLEKVKILLFSAIGSAKTIKFRDFYAISNEKSTKNESN